MGTVYRARDPILDRMVALKTVSAQLLANEDVRVRFQREARAAARLQHPNIVTVFELGEADGTVYIAMELLPGMDLVEAMVPAERLPLPEKLRTMVQVCRGLDFAHKKGVIHRDVKPANIRLLPDGTVKLVDFGIARMGDSTRDPDGSGAGHAQLPGAGGAVHRPHRLPGGHVVGGRDPARADHRQAALPGTHVRRRWPTRSCTSRCRRSTRWRSRCRTAWWRW